MTSKQLRKILQENLDEILHRLNEVLAGKKIQKIEKVLQQIGHKKQLPHWYSQLKNEQTLPNLDGKTIGSVIEMLLVAVLETYTFAKYSNLNLSINPARGVDIPALDLNIKSPSENFSTSEPFFSAYDRLLGSEYDVLVLLTDYQTAKKTPPLQLKILKWEYLLASQLADKKLCEIAKKHRKWLVKTNESHAKKVMRFLAYINQSDWRAKNLLKLVKCLDNEDEISQTIQKIEQSFQQKNKKLAKQDELTFSKKEIEPFQNIYTITPKYLGVIDAIDNWVIENHKDFGRLPNENEWNRLKNSPLDGKIGLSFALQWRCNFRAIF